MSVRDRELRAQRENKLIHKNSHLVCLDRDLWGKCCPYATVVGNFCSPTAIKRLSKRF